MDLFEETHREFIRLLNRFEAEYMLIGGHSVNLHGYPRATGDLDIWVNGTEENGLKVIKAIEEFGFAVEGLKGKDFEEILMFTLGSKDEPNYIEITNKIAGITFQESYKNHLSMSIEDFHFKMINFEDLIKNKRASARHRP